MLSMKKIGLLVAAAALTSFVAGSAFADGTEVKADVPFAFHAGDLVLPAGTYLFTMDDPELPDVLTIQSQDGKRHEFVITSVENELRAIDQTQLVFDQRGRNYFLAEVRPGGFDEARVLRRSERDVARKSDGSVTIVPGMKG